MKTFIIARHGSNAANQSRTLRKVLGTVQAEDSEQAKHTAAQRWTCFNNQHFEAIDTAGRTQQADRDEAATQDAMYTLEVG